MNSRKWLILALAIVAMMSLATYTGVTRSFFVDDEQSSDDALGIEWGLTILSDGFEGTPWDANWDENGTTSWTQESSKPHSGTYNTFSDQNNPGYLTTDELNASEAGNITASFWFNPKNLEVGDCLVQTYNGISYTTWYDLVNYPAYNNNAWCLFNEVISDSQYFIAGFRLRFNTSGLGDSTEEINIDDVNLALDAVPPVAPTGLTATLGDTEISLDWNDNTEDDLWGYNVYRSLTSSSNYTQVNGSPVITSNYTDTGLTNGTTYYYVVTAVDYGNNESGYSNEDSATATDLPPAAPTGLVATDGNEEISLDWNDNTEGDLDGYNVYRSLTSGDNYTQLNGSPVTSSNYTDAGLYGGGTYYYVVTAVDLTSNESGYSNEDSATAIDIAPAAPTGLAATAGNEEISLDWNDNIEGDLDGYNVYRSETSNSSYSKLNGSLVTSSDYTDTPLYGGGTYYYVVTAVDATSNESGYSNEDSATAIDIAPAAPTGLVATAGGEQVSLDWNDNTEGDLDGYNVYRSLTSSSNYTQVNVGLVATSNYTDVGLLAGVPYYYVVTAVDLGSNESGYSNEDSATPTDLPPAAPTGLVATGGNEEISLDWDDNTEGDLDGYNVYRSLSSGDNYTQINGTLVSTSNYTDTGLYGGGTYYYVVTAVDLGSNESGYSSEDNATAINVSPAAPTGLAATPGGEQVSLDWNDNIETDLDGYNVYRSESGGGPYSQINGSLVTTSNYTDTGLYGGGTYYYVVTAVDNATAESGYSNEDSAIATDAPPAAPTGLVATPGDRQVSLDWDDNTEGDLDGYNVYRSESGGGPYSQINGTLVTSSDYTDSTVHGGTTYYYVVTAVDTGALESDYSNEASTTPLSPTLINDGFEGDPWDANWDENGTTTWRQEVTPSHSGTYSVHVDNAYTGYLTSDDIDASASTNTTVNFWFYPKGLEAGDCLIQTYNGTAYNTWYDLTSYTTFANDQWCEFNEILSDSQYFVSHFRIRFDASALVDGNDNMNIDDVLIITDSLPPAAPTNLAATPGETEVSLDWDDNTELDLDGYNVYRSLTSGDNYTKVNGSLVTTSNYTDTGLTNGVTYYYVVTAVDLGSNESGYSNEASAIPVDLAPAAPTNLAATPGETEISLDWDDNTEPDLDGYNVYRSLSSNGTYSKVNVGLVATSNYTDTGLTNGVTYYYVVTAVDLGSNESGYSNEASAAPVDAPPAAPTNLAVTPGDKQVSLDWDDNTEPDMDGYNVYRSLSSNGTYSKVNVGLVATSNYTDTGLTGGVTYYYVVTAVDLGSNEGGYSNEASATPTDPPPVAPTNLAATPGDKQVSLEWDDNTEPDLDGYNVYRSETGGGPYSKVNGSLVATSNYTDTGLTGNVTYYYVVTAVDLGSNEGGYSNEASATPTDPPPAAPTNLAATPGDRQVSLDWDDNTEDDLDGYNVYRSETGGGPYSKINGSLVATSNYTDTGLTGNVTYYYVVTAVDLASNESGYSNEASATPTDSPPAAPTGLAATPGDRQVSLDWDDNTEDDLDGYNVYRSESGGGPYTQVNGSLVAASAYTDTGLTGNVTYYYVVTAVDLASNESGYSNEASATPTDPPPVAPTNLAATPGEAEISLDWDDNSEDDLDGYNVYRSESMGGPYTQVNGSLVVTSLYTDTGLTNGVTYYYVVTAVDLASHEGGYSNEASAAPVDVAPVAPTGLIATPGNGQVSLNWDDNTEPDLDGYNVYRSLSSNGTYSKVNVGLVTSSDYTDTGLTNGVTYYYVVTAVDLGSNESVYSNEDSATPFYPPIILLDDDFEGTPWDAYWDGNGTTDWQTGAGYNSTNSAETYSGDTYLTSDDLDASAADNITVSFWFMIKDLNKGPLYVQTYNGTAYNNWYDLVVYANGQKNVWLYFSETITDSQYLISNFRLRFDGSGLTTDGFIDDVLIITNQ